MRREIKYEITKQEYYDIKTSLEKLAEKDILKKEFNIIKTLYLDNLYNTILKESIEGNINREKYRLRMYNNDDSDIFLEKKMKREDTVFKYREQITKEDVNKICEGDIDSFLNATKLKTDFYIQAKTRILKPKIIIQYNREAYEHTLTNTRITLDTNITKDCNTNNFFKTMNNISGRKIYILEVKYESLIPRYIWDILKIKEQRQKGSKYVRMRMKI